MTTTGNLKRRRATTETNSLPLGPRDIGATWYANARLAYNTFGLYLQGDCLPKGALWMIFMTRVVEKSSNLAQAILHAAFEELKIAMFPLSLPW